MRENFTISPVLATRERAALEHLLYFNVNQERMRRGIQRSIQTYGIPEIVEKDDSLQIRVGRTEGVQSLFAVSELGNPLGVAVFVRPSAERIVVLHIGVMPRLWSDSSANTRVLLELIHEVRCTAKRFQDSGRFEVIYSQRRTHSG